MENYGLAIIDADQVIKVNSKFTKAYYRKGQAYLMLSKLDEAREAFKVAN
jgi:serine/threonine-protein phosphatase 5